MKTYLITVCTLLLLLGACQSSPLTKKATGVPYEIVVNTGISEWEGELGETIKDDLQSDVPGLPQSEPAMRITYASPDNFNGLLTYVRNIFIANVNPSRFTQVTLRYERDKWAQGQVVVTLNAPTTEEAIAYLKNHPRILVKFFTSIEMQRTADIFEKEYNLPVWRKVNDMFGASLKVPTDFNFTREATDFFWSSNNANTGRMDIVIYTFPYTDPNTFTNEYLIHKRDSVMKVNIPGSYPNSYMTTETKYVIPDYSAITINGKYCGVMRGLWRMEGDKMGGPFVSHTRLDENENKVFVVEAFVYAPETIKRNYMRRAEAALYTLRLPDEPEETSDIIIVPSGLEEQQN